MQILHIMKDYKPNSGGSVVRNSNMLENYKKNYGNEILIANLDGSKYEPQSLVCGIKVYRSRSIRELMKCVIRILKSKPIDIIHAHNFRFMTLAYICNHMSGNRSRIIVELHAIYRMRKWKEALSYRILRRADKVIVLSEGAKKYLAENKKMSKDKIAVIRNGLSVQEIGNKAELVVKLEKLEGKTIIGYIGSLYEWQGVNFLIDNMEFILSKYENVIFLMIGNGPEKEAVKRFYDTSDHKDRIFISDGIPADEVNSVYQVIDIVVIPRLKELTTDTAIPLKAVEAMQQCKTILASNDNGLTELLNISNSKIFKAGNPKDFQKKISELLESKELRMRLAYQAKKDVYEIIKTWSESAHLLQQIYIEKEN